MMTFRAGLLLLIFVAATMPLMLVQQLFKWTWPTMARRFPHFYHRFLAKLLGFHIEVIGHRPTTPALLVSNHVSWIDIVVLSAALPVSFIAKREVAGWPFFGALAKLQRTVFVDRQKRTATGSSRDEISERLSKGDTLVLFPEGTSHDGLHVLPFKSSFFASAEKSPFAVVPITLAYTKLCGLTLSRRTRPHVAWYGDMDLAPHLWQALKAGPLEAKVVFHPPLVSASRKHMATEAENLIRRSLAEVLHGRMKSR
jgi:lyso-ornithine lipid O-acyltransferase